jgi:hypothetical protein
MTASGKLLLTSDRKSFKDLTMNVKLSDGQEVTVTFVADAAERKTEYWLRDFLLVRRNASKECDIRIKQSIRDWDVYW